MRAFPIAGCIAMLTFGASAEERDCHCGVIALNGRLDTADFDGGVGRAVDDGANGGSGRIATSEASAAVFAHARAFARGVGAHGGHVSHDGAVGHRGG